MTNEISVLCEASNMLEAAIQRGSVPEIIEAVDELEVMVLQGSPMARSFALSALGTAVLKAFEHSPGEISISKQISA